jgi:hypothetical protein
MPLKTYNFSADNTLRKYAHFHVRVFVVHPTSCTFIQLITYLQLEILSFMNKYLWMIITVDFVP